jgi:predicted Fe-Mo cluster-binding NifX family protein
MNIAIPVWEGKISPVFDSASRLLIIQVEHKNEKSRFEVYLEEQDLARRCFHVQRLGVEILICGAISCHLHRMLTASGIKVIPWISGSAEDVLQSYFNGDLFQAKFLMPGCDRKKVDIWLNNKMPERAKNRKAPWEHSKTRMGG